MPVTPLHFAVALKYRDDKWVKGFIAANIVVDFDVIVGVLFDLPGRVHGTSHTLWGAVLLAFLFVMLAKPKWWAGALWGAVSHVLLDSIVHSDVLPFWPFITTNPFYIPDSYYIVSWLCLTSLAIGFLLLLVTEISWGTLSDSDG